MKFGLAKCSMVAAFLAGAALVHCGTTPFQVVGDGGTEAGSGKEPKKDGGASHASSQASSVGSSVGSSSGSSAGSGSGSGGGPCWLTSDCSQGLVCCIDFKTGALPTCQASGTADCVVTCGAPTACADSTDVCCLFPTVTTRVGGCLKTAECVLGKGAEWCDPKATCQPPQTCEAEDCAGTTISVCSGTDQCKGSGSGVEVACTPGAVPSGCPAGETCCSPIPGGGSTATCVVGNACPALFKGE